MKVTFLGTGTSQGVPVIGCECEVCQSDNPQDKRLRTSVMIQTEGKNFVIDTGPDFRQQMLREKVKSMDGILFTHEHKDHIAGLDDIRAFNFVQRKDMQVFANQQVQKALKRDYHYAFEKVKYPGVPQIQLEEIKGEPFKASGVEFTPIEVMHYKMPVLGFRVGDFTYITDANYISEREKEKIRGSKVFVINALRKTDHISHYSLSGAIELARELGVEKTYLIHMSHQMGLHQVVEKELPNDVHLAYDSLSIEV